MGLIIETKILFSLCHQQIEIIKNRRLLKLESNSLQFFLGSQFLYYLIDREYLIYF